MLASGFSSAVTSPCCRWPSGPSGTLERPCGGLSGLWPSYRLWRWYGAGEELLVGRLTSSTLELRRSPHIYAGKISYHNGRHKYCGGGFFRPFPSKNLVLEPFSLLEEEWFSQADLSPEFYPSVPSSMSAAPTVVFHFYGHQPPSSTI